MMNISELWQAFNMWYAFSVFIILLLADLVWAEWTRALVDRKAVRASIMSMGTVIVSAFTAISYVSNPLYILPAMIGAYVGTYLSVIYHKEAGNGTS